MMNYYSHPVKTRDHPEIENTDVLNDDMHINYQILIGMLVWICVIIRAEVAHATSSLSLFTVL